MPRTKRRSPRFRIQTPEIYLRIELTRLGQAGKALKYFNTYRTRNPQGPPAEEALIGTAEAHRRLGNKKAEAAALTDLVRQYPNSTSITKAKDRLQDIGEL